MEYLPLFVSLQGRSCLVVGAGSVALRKLEWLVEAGAEVFLVAKEIAAATEQFAAEHDVTLAERDFEANDVEGRYLVVAATNDSDVNRSIYNACEANAVLINTVDDAALCTAIFPSIVNRDPVLVAVGTGGRSPTLARLVRGWIERRLPARLGALADWAGDWRTRVADALPSIDARRTFWESTLESSIAEAVYRGEIDAADREMIERLEQQEVTAGFVSLVGAGPGDPELLTIKALRCLETADVIYYDNLVSDAVLDLARREAERIYVGKKRADHTATQDEINTMLVDAALAGQRVVRLKGGDPSIFSRGGEELQALAARGIPYEIVPGITAAMGCAAYAGIPLTHRDCAQSVRFITGHRASDRTNLDWPELAKPDQTLVIYMGLGGLENICEQLIANGMDPLTPAALIVRGTLPEMEVVEAPVSELAEAVRQHAIKGPTTIIIGRVVGLRSARGG